MRSSWSVESFDPVDVPDWTPENPARGQCGVTALVVHELLGGELLEAEVLFPDGTRQGYHYWNRLVGGDVDLTREQFTDGEQIQAPRVVPAPSSSAGKHRLSGQHALLRQRVLSELHAAGEREPRRSC
ncbi:MAG: YunG family protein [Acidimicrobiales bacterium]